MIGPTWLAAIFGVIMLVAAVVAAVRIIAAWRAHRLRSYRTYPTCRSRCCRWQGRA